MLNKNRWFDEELDLCEQFERNGHRNHFDINIDEGPVQRLDYHKFLTKGETDESKQWD